MLVSVLGPEQAGVAAEAGAATRPNAPIRLAVVSTANVDRRLEALAGWCRESSGLMTVFLKVGEVADCWAVPGK